MHHNLIYGALLFLKLNVYFERDQHLILSLRYYTVQHYQMEYSHVMPPPVKEFYAS